MNKHIYVESPRILRHKRPNLEGELYQIEIKVF